MLFSVCLDVYVCTHVRMHTHTHARVRVPCVCRCLGKPKEGFRSPRSWSCQQLYELSNLDPVNQTCVPWKGSMHSQSLRHLSSESPSYYCHWLIAPDQSKPAMDQGVWIQPPDVPIFISHRQVSVKVIKVIL